MNNDQFKRLLHLVRDGSSVWESADALLMGAECDDIEHEVTTLERLDRLASCGIRGVESWARDVIGGHDPCGGMIDMERQIHAAEMQVGIVAYPC